MPYFNFDDLVCDARGSGVAAKSKIEPGIRQYTKHYTIYLHMNEYWVVGTRRILYVEK